MTERMSAPLPPDGGVPRRRPAEETSVSPDLISKLFLALDIAKRRLWHFLVPFAAILLLGIGIILLLPRAYLSEARILIDAPQIRPPAVAAEAASAESLADWIEGLQQRVTARQRLLDLVRTFDLFPAARASLAGLSPGERRAGEARVAEMVRAKIQITPVLTNLTGTRRIGLPLVLAVSFEYGDAETATKVTSALVAMILEEDVRARTARASETVRFLDRETGRARQGLDAAEAEIAAFTGRNREALPDRIEYQVAELRSRQSRLDKLDADARSLEDQERMLDFELRMKLAGTKGGLGDGAAERLRVLRTEVARREAIYASAHPLLKAARQELAATEEQMRLPPRGTERADAETPAGTPADVAILMEKEKALQPRKQDIADRRAETLAEIAALKAIIARVPEVRAELVGLERQRVAAQADFDEVARKLAAAKLSEEVEHVQQDDRFTVIEPPVLPQYPISPVRKKLAVLAFLAALAVAAGYVAALELYATTIAKVVRRSQDLGRMAEDIDVAILPEIGRRSGRLAGRLRPLTAALVLIGIAFGLHGASRIAPSPSEAAPAPIAGAAEIR